MFYAEFYVHIYTHTHTHTLHRKCICYFTHNVNTHITSVTYLFTSRDQCTTLLPPCCTIYSLTLYYWKQFVCNVTNWIQPIVISSEECQCDRLCLHIQKISTSVLSQISDDLELIDWAATLKYQVCCRYRIECTMYKITNSQCHVPACTRTCTKLVLN